MNDEQFQQLAQRFDKLDDTIQRLYQHAERRFNELETRLAGKSDKSDVDRVYDLLDKDIKTKEIDDHERLAANNQLDRHEDWIVRAAPKLNVRYDPSA